MKKETELLKAIGDIDEKYILEAMPKASDKIQSDANVSAASGSELSSVTSSGRERDQESPNESHAGVSSSKDMSGEKRSAAENGNDKVIHITNKRYYKPIGTIAAALIIVLGFSAYMTVFNGNKETLAPQAVMQDTASAEAISGNNISEDAISDEEAEESMILKSADVTQKTNIANDISPEKPEVGAAPEAVSDKTFTENAGSEENAARNSVRSGVAGEASNENTARDALKTEGVGEASGEKKSVMTMIANPWHDSSTLSEAEKDAGFDITIPESFLDSKPESFRSMTDDMLEIIYRDTASLEVFRVRKSNAAGEDISGDYNSYDNERTVSIDGTEVTLKGTGDNVYVATWTKNGYSFAIDIDSEQTIEASEIPELINQIS